MNRLPILWLAVVAASLYLGSKVATFIVAMLERI